jgi:replicative DNA helicase
VATAWSKSARPDEQTPLSIIHEQAALACPLADERTLDEMADLQPAHFQLPLHSAIWQAMARLHQVGTPLTLPAVLSEVRVLLVADADLWAVARSYVPQLTILHPVPVGADYYAAQVQEYARYRAAREKAGALLEYGDEDLRGLAVVTEMAALVAQPSQQTAPRSQAQVMDATLAAIDARRTDGTAAGLPTGIPGLAALGGFRAGHFVVLAARPEVGKSLLAYQMAQHMAAAGHVGIYASLEMDAEELAERSLVAQSLVPPHALAQAVRLSDDNWMALEQAGQTLGTRPLAVIDAGGVTLDAILSWARRYKQQAGLAFLVIDHVQLLPLPNPERVTQQAALSAVTKRLKATARQMGICIIGLSQLNRPGEGARPGLVNLSGSDTLGHDADLVLMLWPNDEAGTDGYSADGLRHLVLDVRKNRHGPSPTVHMVMNPATLTMREVTR